MLVVPNFAQIERADLESDERLAALYAEAVHRGWWRNTPANVLDFWSLAEKALQEDSHGTPGRLFHALVKANERSRITNAQEERAQRRMPSHARSALVIETSRGRSPGVPAEANAGALETAQGQSAQTTSEVWAGDADRVVFHHSIMMMCFLPQKRMPDGQREHIVRHGRAALLIEAGSLIDPGTVGKFRAFPVPYGSRARLILPYINGYALRHRTRTVDLGRSLRRFMSRLGLSFDGRRGQAILEQVQALAAAHILLGVWNEPAGHAQAHLTKITDAVSFWIERDTRQRALWEPHMTLSSDYYDAISERPVPLDMTHLVQLSRSPRRMDVYAWLTYRTARIPQGKEVRVRLAALQEVFGPGIDRFRLFKERFRSDLQAVGAVYPEFRVNVEHDVVVLRRSPPPIARRGAITANPSPAGK